MICPNCNSHNEDHLRYCRKCGSPLYNENTQNIEQPAVLSEKPALKEEEKSFFQKYQTYVFGGVAALALIVGAVFAMNTTGPQNSVADNTSSLVEQANTLFQMGNIDSAKALYEEVLKQDPDNELARQMLEAIVNGNWTEVNGKVTLGTTPKSSTSKPGTYIPSATNEKKTSYSTPVKDTSKEEKEEPEEEVKKDESAEETEEKDEAAKEEKEEKNSSDKPQTKTPLPVETVSTDPADSDADFVLTYHVIAINPGDSWTLNADMMDREDLEWTLSYPVNAPLIMDMTPSSLVSVEDGEVIANDNGFTGSVVVTATSRAGKEDSCLVIVDKEASHYWDNSLVIIMNDLELIPESGMTIKMGYHDGPVLFRAADLSNSFNDPSVSWESSNEDVAYVSEDGNYLWFYPSAKGKTTLTATDRYGDSISIYIEAVD